MKDREAEASPRSSRWSIADRRELENQYRDHVEFARALYQDLRSELARHREWAEAALTQDRELIQDRCRQLHESMLLALEQYRVELQRFNRLVLDGKRPE